MFSEGNSNPIFSIRPCFILNYLLLFDFNIFIHQKCPYYLLLHMDFIFLPGKLFNNGYYPFRGLLPRILLPWIFFQWISFNGFLSMDFFQWISVNGFYLWISFNRLLRILSIVFFQWIISTNLIYGSFFFNS